MQIIPITNSNVGIAGKLKRLRTSDGWETNKKRLCLIQQCDGNVGTFELLHNA